MSRKPSNLKEEQALQRMRAGARLVPMHTERTPDLPGSSCRAVPSVTRRQTKSANTLPLLVRRMGCFRAFIKLGVC